MEPFPKWAIFGPERSLAIPAAALQPLVPETPPEIAHKARIRELLLAGRAEMFENAATKKRFVEAARLAHVSTIDDLLRHPEIRGMLLALEILL